VVYILYLNQATLVLLSISFVAYLLDPSIDRLEHLGLSRTLAIGLLTSVVLVGIGVLFLVVIPQLQLQVRQVADRAPRWGQWLYAHLTPLMEAAEAPLFKYFGIALDIESLKMYAVRLWGWVMAHLPDITQGLLSIFQTMFTGLANFIVGVLQFCGACAHLLPTRLMSTRCFYGLPPPHWRPNVAGLGEIDHAVGIPARAVHDCPHPCYPMRLA
jgi:predicted PurR-regulated permease PerM